MAPMRAVPATVLFAGTLSAFLMGASNPCMLMTLLLLVVAAVVAGATAIVYVEDLRKYWIVYFGLRQPEEATFVQYCEHHHPFYSCFFEARDTWAGRPQRLLLYITSLWIMFMWSLYSDSKFAYLTTEFTTQLAKCQYWTTVMGILIIPRVCVIFMEAMLRCAQQCDDATLVDRVEEKVDILASGASAVQREAATQHLSYCLLAVKNGIIVSFCISVYVITILGFASAATKTSFFIWFIFILQFVLALLFDTLQTFVAYYYSIEYGELPYLRAPRSNMDRYYTDDADIDELDMQNAIHDELGL